MPADPQRVQAIFLAAAEHSDPAGRAALLARECGEDLDLRRRVEELLLAHDQPQSFLERPAAPFLPTIAEGPVSQAPGMVIGPYKLLQQIGEGGMGTVYMAEQTHPVQRTVALKLIKAGLDNRQVIARFEAERQALALMDHPNIARVLDAGTTEGGQPYFVMELVHGVAITKYCDQHRLTPRQRLELFIPVCQAIQHAHQKGIIHRDIKPSNVMVTLYDGKPVPKVIDFGVAKAVGQKLTESTLFTEFGSIVGTLEYMSPEQAEQNQYDIDTRSDIYSLGVLLYELLTGTTPLDKKHLRGAAILEMLRIIKEDEPQRPSTRLSTTDELPSIAANRSLEPKKLSGLLRGELDWIVMKALEKDRNRRYETANGFATDIQRYLADEQVLACPPSVGYRLRKLARRNRPIIMTLAVVLTTLTIGVTVSVTQAVRATRAEWLAEERLQTETKARNEAEEMRKRADDNARKARQTVDEYFTMVSESQLLNVPGLQPLRKRLLESAMKYYESLRDEQAGNSSVRAELAAMRVRIAQVHLQNNKIDDSIREWARTLDVIDELSQENPLPTGFPECLAGLLKSGRIVTYFSLWPSDPQEAVRVYQRAVTTWEHFVRDYPEISGFQSDLACFYRDLGDQQNLVRDNSGALRSFEASRGILEKLVSQQPGEPDYSALLADALEYQSGTLQVFERLGEAETASRRAVAIRNQLVSDFPDVPEYRASYAYSFVRLGTLLDAIGRRNEAVQAFEQAVNRWHALVLDFPTVPGFRKRLTDALRDLAGIHLKAGRVTDAEGLLRQANEIISQLAGEDPGERGDNLFEAFEVHEALASVLNSAGRLQEAQEQWQLAAEIAQKIAQLGVGFLGLDLQAFVWRISAGAAWNLGNRKEAERCYGEALHVYQELAIRRPGNFYYRYLLADTRRLFAGGLATEGRTAEAVAEYRRAIATHEEYLAEFDNQPVDVGQWTSSYTELAGLLKGNGRAEEAAKIYQKLLQALGRLASHYPAEPRIVNALATAHQEVGAFEQQRGRIDRAEQSYQRALDLWTKLTSGLPGKAEYRVHAATLLMTHLAPMLDASGRAADAEQAFQRGVVECNKLAADFPGVPEYRHQRVELLLRRGNSLHFTRARTREAEQPYRDALAEAERLVAGFPDVLRYRMQLMDCRRFTALILVDTGRPQEAGAFARQALDLATKLADESPAYPGVKAKLARVHWILGKAFAGSAHAEDAEKAFRKAVTLLETLAADSPSDRRELALVHRDLAVLLATDQNRLIEAETSYRLAIQLLAKVVADVPGEPYYRHELATCYNELAGVLARQGNRADGTPEWDKVAVEYTKAIELKPDAWEAWSGRALVHFRRQQWDAAIADFSKAIELAPQEHTNLWHRGHGYLNLELWDKAVADFTKIVDQMPEAAEGWYLRGVAVAQLNQPDKALADLRQAITKGFKNVDLMKNDSRLDPLRTREDFGKLLEELEQKEKSQSQ